MVQMQFIGTSKFVLIWCFLIIIAVFLSPVFSDVDNLCNVNCTGCNCDITGSGSCSLQLNPECNETYDVNLNFESETSIIELVASVEYVGNTTYLTEHRQDSETSGIKIGIFELIEYDHGKRKYMLLETRHLHVDKMNIRNETSYLTRTSIARLVILDTMHLSSCDMKLFFKEIQYRRYMPTVENLSDSSGVIPGQYRPNSVSLYQFREDPNVKWNAIEITLLDLEIDTERGEYLLIGAGTSEDFPPLFVTQITKNSSFYVGNSSAYIELVTGPTLKADKSFTILWTRKDPQPFPGEMDPSEVLNSYLICFYNSSAAKKEFEKENDAFIKFRQSFAESARSYSKSKDKNIDIDETFVKLIGYPTEVNGDALSVLITVMDERKSIFSWNELQTLTAEFEKHDKNKTLGYKVGKCPHREKELPYQEKWSVLIYACVPAFGFFFLMTWAWKKNIFSQKCTPEKEEQLPSVFERSAMEAVPNMYESTIPKEVYGNQGRQETLIQGSSQAEAERTSDDNVTVVEMHAVTSVPVEPDSLTRFLTRRKSKQRPSLHSLIPNNEETTEQSDAGENEANESEHLYDSVNSNQISETQL